MKKIFIALLSICLISTNVISQPKDINSMTKEDVLNMPYDKLLEMDLETVMRLADIVGVSMDELYEMLLNKDVSSASKKAESSFEAPLSTTVLSSDEIVQSGARNIEEALRLVPGMIIREKTNGNFDIHIRGNDNLPPDNMFIYSENTMSLVMIDGRPVYNYVNGGTFWECLPISIADIDRIEIVRGAASALYGANAATGVINIITKRPDSKDLSINGSVTGGSQASKIANINIGQSINTKLGYRVSANYEYMERTTDLLYSLKMDSMYKVQDLFNEMDPQLPWIKLTDPGDGNGLNKYPHTNIARDKWGVNGGFYYEPNGNIKTRFNLGSQYSDVLSTTFGDQVTPLSTRVSNTSYVDFSGEIYGFTTQVNYNFGYQDVVKGDEGFKVDMNVLNASGEYDFYVKGLNIRPGVYYQNATYDDSKHLSTVGNGFLNGERELSSIGGGLRADYMFKGIRFIAGVRAEKYNVNSEIYLPFQLISTYNLNDKHMFRANYSRANRSPFLVDTYADFNWDRSARSYPQQMKFTGSQDLELAKVDMIEVGYRVKPHKAVQVDIEAFMTTTTDYGYLSPDSVVGNFALVSTTNVVLNNSYTPIGLPPTAIPAPAIPEFVNMAYQNIPLESKQYGVTANVDWVVNKNLIVKAHGTVQVTKLENYCPLNTNEIIEAMMKDAGYTMTVANMMGQTPPNIIPNMNNLPTGTSTTTFFSADNVAGPGVTLAPYPSMLAYSTTRPDSLISIEHSSTPSFYGGISANYTAFEKMNIFVSAYYYGAQDFKNMYGTYKIEPKVITNIKVSYKVWNDNAVFLNARNLFNDNKAEFAWGDKTQGTYLVGLDIKF